MADFELNTKGITEMEAFEIERQARIEQSRYIAAGLRSLLRGIVARLRPAATAHTA